MRWRAGLCRGRAYARARCPLRAGESAAHLLAWLLRLCARVLPVTQLPQTLLEASKAEVNAAFALTPEGETRFLRINRVADTKEHAAYVVGSGERVWLATPISTYRIAKSGRTYVPPCASASAQGAFANAV